MPGVRWPDDGRREFAGEGVYEVDMSVQSRCAQISWRGDVYRIALATVSLLAVMVVSQHGWKWSLVLFRG